MKRALAAALMITSIVGITYGYGNMVSIKNNQWNKYLQSNWSTPKFVGSAVGDWERWEEINLGGGVYAYRSAQSCKYLAVDDPNNDLGLHTCKGSWQQFYKEAVSGGYALKSQKNNKYLTVWSDGSVKAYASTVGSWEVMTISAAGKGGMITDFFDGFDGSSLDMNKWQYQNV